MAVGETFTWIRRTAPHLSSRSLAAIVFALAILFPIVHPNDADIDSAANALTYAALALGLNIVVGLAGLLDLGYAAFFAIGAYAYGIAASWQVTPEWSSFWDTFQWLGLVVRFPETGGDVASGHFRTGSRSRGRRGRWGQKPAPGRGSKR